MAEAASRLTPRKELSTQYCPAGIARGGTEKSVGDDDLLPAGALFMDPRAAKSCCRHRERYRPRFGTTQAARVAPHSPRCPLRTVTQTALLIARRTLAKHIPAYIRSVHRKSSNSMIAS